MFPGGRFRSNAEVRWTEYPIWIRERVEKTEIFETTITRLEAIPFRLFDTSAHVALRIGAPTSRGHEQRIKKPSFSIRRLHQERTVEHSRTGLVVQITLILVQIAVDAEAAITDLEARDDREVARLFA